MPDMRWRTRQPGNGDRRCQASSREDPVGGRSGWSGALPDGPPRSVPPLRVAVVARSWRFGNHAEQQARWIAHDLPGVDLLDAPGAELLKPENFGIQIIGVNVDVRPGLPIADPLDQQPD